MVQRKSMKKVYITLFTYAEHSKKCFDIWGILKMATVKFVEPGNNSFSIIKIIRCRSNNLSQLSCLSVSWRKVTQISQITQISCLSVSWRKVTFLHDL